jgi:hypothetical protein
VSTEASQFPSGSSETTSYASNMPSKRQRASPDASPPRKRRTQTRAAPKRRAPYRFTFGKHAGKTIQEVYAESESFIEDFIIGQHLEGRHNLLTKYPALAEALRNIPEEFVDQNPSLERALNYSAGDTPSVLNYQGTTERGKMNMKESGNYRFWEAIDKAAVRAFHKNAPTVKLADLAGLLDDARSRSGHPIHIAFTATVIYIARTYTEFGMGLSGDAVKTLPCGWSYLALMPSFETNVYNRTRLPTGPV